jgi:hypothetical protein
MNGFRTTIWVAAALAIGLTACTKKEAATTSSAAPAAQSQPMAQSGTAPAMVPAGAPNPRPVGEPRD